MPKTLYHRMRSWASGLMANVGFLRSRVRDKDAQEALDDINTVAEDMTAEADRLGERDRPAVVRSIHSGKRSG